MAIEYIDTAFENASPVNWEVLEDGTVQIDLLYDHERGAPNRAAGHWHLRLIADPGSLVNVRFRNFDNIWNGKHGSPVSAQTPCFLSADGTRWFAVPCRGFVENTLAFQIPMPADSDSILLARLEPYTQTHLERLLDAIRSHPRVEIRPIGQTVEGRPLEIVRVGNPEAPYSVLLRARAHPWEPGGNWVIQGLIRQLLQDAPKVERYLERYCVYCLPLANKDGVARGYTRFNVRGKDLNRDWDAPADPVLAPENAALEAWLDERTAQGRAVHLAIDLHNDRGGKLHPAHPTGRAEVYQRRMGRFEALLREHTWFTEGMTGPNFRNPGTFAEGLCERYGIDALVFELNCEWIAGLNKIPFGSDWEQLGAQLGEVFFRYFEEGLPG